MHTSTPGVQYPSTPTGLLFRMLE